MLRELKKLIIELAYEKKKVILSSGRESDFYIDLRNITLHHRGLYLVSKLFLDAIRTTFPGTEAVGGPTLGADPIAAGISVVSELEKTPLHAFIIRKEPKKHGMSRLIEGERNLRPGMKVVIVEDVVTSGESSFKAWNAARDSGLDVLGIAAIVDREDGAAGFFAEKKIPFFSLLNKSDITGRQA